jgi:moderate conductance mechanosensitive channel
MTKHVARMNIRLYRLLILMIALAGLLVGRSALAQAPEPSPEKLRALTELLRDPTIQVWLQTQAKSKPPVTEDSSTVTRSANIQEVIVGHIDSTRRFLRELAATAPKLPGELLQAWSTLSAEVQERGPVSVVALLALFAVLGFGVEWLFWWATAGLRRSMIAMSLDTAKKRLHAAWTRTIYGTGVLLAYAIGSVGAFLLFDWPPVLRGVVLAYLLAFLVIRLTLVLGRIVLAPGAERFRLIPMADVTARFWFIWSGILVAYFSVVKVTFDLLPSLGVSRVGDYLFGVLCGIVLLGLALYVVWCHPSLDSRPRESHKHWIGSALLSLYLLVVWLLLFTGTATPFYIGVILLLLWIAIRINHLAVPHVLRPAGAEPTNGAVHSLTIVTWERGIRAALLIGAACLVAWIAGIDLGSLSEGGTTATRLLRGAINVVVIVLLANFAWYVARAWIDHRLTAAAGEVDGDEARRDARLRTLLPIVRNVLFVVLIVMAALVALSSLGIEIGPLIAGAGVVGVAVGFGAQTLVKDIISGIFFLLDDAFRVGEYIESGNIRGTVEGFSLRSIKLRHQRGALHTIPFGSLEKITNYSRDWAIDKIMVGVTYDTDLAKVKRIIKEIGKELQADPEFAPFILESLKMQGVEQFGDFAIQIRMKLMTKPGEQFAIRRRAYALIKRAFDANGIKFAYPTVQVAGGEQATAAAAQQGIELLKPPTPAD